MSNKYILAVTVLLILGCAHFRVQYYNSPTTPDTAMLTIVNSTKGILEMYTYQDVSNCKNRLFLGKLQSIDARYKIGLSEIPKFDTSNNFKLKIAANIETAYSFYFIRWESAEINISSDITISFFARKDHFYKIELFVLSSPDSSRLFRVCRNSEILIIPSKKYLSWSVLEFPDSISNNKEGQQPDSLKYWKTIIAWDERGPFCRPYPSFIPSTEENE